MTIQTQPQTFLGGVDHTGIPGSELTRVIIGPLREQHAALAEWDRTGVFEDDGRGGWRELSPSEAFAEAVEELGLVFDENGILIEGEGA